MHVGVITKLIVHRGDLQPTCLVALGLIGTLNPSPNQYYATSIDYVNLLIMSEFL